MGYSRKAPQVHAYEKIMKALEQDSLENVLLLCGPEKYLVHWALGKIKERYVQPAVEMFDYMKLDGGQCDFEEIRNACETMPMLSEKRVVVVDDYHIGRVHKPENANEDEDAEEEEKNPEAEQMAEYLQNFPETTVLVLLSDDAKNRKPFTTVRKVGGIYDFQRLDIAKLKGFLTKRFKELGKRVQTGVCVQIAEMSGYYDKETDCTLYQLIQNVEKVAAYAAEVVTSDDVEAVLSDSVERDVFAFTDAMANGRKGEALRLLSVLLSYGEPELKLLALICSQFEVLLLVKEMLEDGLTTAAMHECTGVHEFRIKKSIPLARKYSRSKLRRLLIKSYEVDRNFKSGMSDMVTALQILIASV